MVYAKTLDSFLNRIDEINKEDICFIEETGQLYTHENYFGYTENDVNDIILNSDTIKDLYSKIDDAKVSNNNILTLRAYIFNVSGTYTKTQLEALLGVELSVLIDSMKKGNPITIFSSDNVSCNISFVVESNCTMTTEGELESLTLFWHQYQLWNTVSISLDSSGNYVMSNTTASSVSDE